jgi:hypothetical protein
MAKRKKTINDPFRKYLIDIVSFFIHVISYSVASPTAICDGFDTGVYTFNKIFFIFLHKLICLIFDTGYDNPAASTIMW